jgi:HPt (histidine-containing phosphotransfer) domain-containing protein
MDVQMPEMGGFEATAAIRKKEQGTGEHLPVVAMTAHAMKGDRERCLRAGMDAYVPKPIRPEELFKAIEQLARPSVETVPGPGATKKTEKAFDKTALLARFDGDVKLLQQLIMLFLADCPKTLLKIEKSIAKQDAIALASAAHALKGSAGNFTSGTTYDAALTLELMGRRGDLAAAGDVFLTLKAELARLKLELGAFTQRLDSRKKDRSKRFPRRR